MHASHLIQHTQEGGSERSSEKDGSREWVKLWQFGGRKRWISVAWMLAKIRPLFSKPHESLETSPVGG